MRKASRIWHLGYLKAMQMISEGYACAQICEALGVSDQWLRKKLKADLPSLYKAMELNGLKRLRKKAWEIYPPALSDAKP